MMTSLSSAVSGLDAFQQQMDIIGNNIANINTTGFKSGTGNLVDSFSDTLQAATGTSTTGTINSMQVGTGVTTASITNNWTTGVINPTNNNNDLAINGNGFFQVQDSSGNTYVTQDGTFGLDSNGNLVTSGGLNVLSSTGTKIQIPLTNASTQSALSSWSVSANGTVTATFADGTTATAGQIGVENFTNPGALVSIGNNLYNNQAAAGPGGVVVPGTSGTGTIEQGALELSNVDLSSQMAALITAQRGFEANSKIVTTSDEVLQDAVQMKR